MIALHTAQRWGRKQRNIYLHQLKARLEWLAENPSLGKARPDIRAGFHSFPESEHVIFYTITDDAIHVIGILHRRMDTDTALDRE